MKSKNIELNQKFIKRVKEQETLNLIKKANEPVILIVHGRRRVGKTELIEQSFRERNLLKFEGLENQPKKDQIAVVLDTLAEYAEDPKISRLKLTKWRQVFELIYEYIKEGEWTLYFEEVQWLANYRSEFISDLKHVWDNKFKNNNKLIVILCGSSPSFMIEKVIKSKSLYNRSNHTLTVPEFNFSEARDFLCYSNSISSFEVLDAYLTIGGIPEYLKYLRNKSSVATALADSSFKKDGFFVEEYEKVFTSSLGKNSNYRDVIELLSQSKYLTKEEIVKKLKLSDGGTVTKLFKDLEESGFISRFNTIDSKGNGKESRYRISDSYLNFYYNFIKPKLNQIKNLDYEENPFLALDYDSYRKWLGYAFERFVRKNSRRVAEVLGFKDVKYDVGAIYVKRNNNNNNNKAIKLEKLKGLQIDLAFKRADRVLTVCEIKYQARKIGVEIINEVEDKIETLIKSKKAYENWTIQRVLISAGDVEDKVANSGFFHRILKFEEIF